MFSTGNNNMSTPQWFFDRLNEVFHFTLDPCADDTNKKCNLYYTEQDDGLTKNWGGISFSVIRHIREKLRTRLVKKISYVSVWLSGKKTMLPQLC